METLKDALDDEQFGLLERVVQHTKGPERSFAVRIESSFQDTADELARRGYLTLGTYYNEPANDFAETASLTEEGMKIYLSEKQRRDMPEREENRPSRLRAGLINLWYSLSPLPVAERTGNTAGTILSFVKMMGFCGIMINTLYFGHKADMEDFWLYAAAGLTPLYPVFVFIDYMQHRNS